MSDTAIKVDVLAGVDALGADYKSYIPQFHAHNRKRMKTILADFDAARAAIDDMITALKKAEAALSDIGDADREPGDDMKWMEIRAALPLPFIREVMTRIGALQ